MYLRETRHYYDNKLNTEPYKVYLKCRKDNFEHQTSWYTLIVEPRLRHPCSVWKLLIFKTVMKQFYPIDFRTAWWPVIFTPSWTDYCPRTPLTRYIYSQLDGLLSQDSTYQVYSLPAGRTTVPGLQLPGIYTPSWTDYCPRTAITRYIHSQLYGLLSQDSNYQVYTLPAGRTTVQGLYLPCIYSYYTPS